MLFLGLCPLDLRKGRTQWEPQRNKIKNNFYMDGVFCLFFCYMTMEIDLWVLLSIWSIVFSINLLINLKLPSIVDHFDNLLLI